MKLEIKRYVREVEAVHFDGITDVQEIAQWCGGMVVELVDNEGRLRKDTYIIDVPCPQGYTTAAKGFYIFKDQGVFYAMDGPTFKSEFRPA